MLIQEVNFWLSDVTFIGILNRPFFSNEGNFVDINFYIAFVMEWL